MTLLLRAQRLSGTNAAYTSMWIATRLGKAVDKMALLNKDAASAEERIQYVVPEGGELRMEVTCSTGTGPWYQCFYEYGYQPPQP